MSHLRGPHHTWAFVSYIFLISWCWFYFERMSTNFIHHFLIWGIFVLINLISLPIHTGNMSPMYEIAGSYLTGISFSEEPSFVTKSCQIFDMSQLWRSERGLSKLQTHLNTWQFNNPILYNWLFQSTKRQISILVIVKVVTCEYRHG